MPDAYMLNYLRRPLQVLASTAWGSPRLGSYLVYEVLADAVGSAPGVPETADPDVRPLTVDAGSVVGPAGAAAAFDGNPDTAFAAETAGAAFGIDLGDGHAVRPAAVRLLPRSRTTADLAALVGARVQGCTDGPDSGCRTLTTLEWTPTRDWITVPLDTRDTYRWLRIVGAPETKVIASEVEFLAPDRGPGDAAIDVSAPAVLKRGGDAVATVRVGNPTGRLLPQIAVGLTAHHRHDNTPLAEQPQEKSVSVPPGESRTVTFPLTPSDGAAPGEYRVRATATAGYGHTLGTGADGPGSRQIRTSVRTSVALRSLAEAYGNIGVTEDGNPQPGAIDGAQSSFSAAGLADAGLEAGGRLAVGGFEFALPERIGGVEDNAVAHGQTIPLDGRAARLGLLVTGTYAPAGGLPGDVTVTYADGTSDKAAVSVPDWAAATPPPETVVAADGGRVNGSSRHQVARPARLYVVSVAADPGKRLASVTLPNGPRYLGAKAPMTHVFALATDPASGAGS